MERIQSITTYGGPYLTALWWSRPWTFNIYMMELYNSRWSAVQQQLLQQPVNKVASHGLHFNKKEVIVLLLDALSAFDLAVIETDADLCGVGQTN